MTFGLNGAENERGKVSGRGAFVTHRNTNTLIFTIREPIYKELIFRAI